MVVPLFFDCQSLTVTYFVNKMSSESSGCDILEKYRNTSNKVKKRFLRKPNVTEACDSFTSLAQQCEIIDLPAYAGLCWIAAARCEGSLSNLPGETSCLVKSARQFLKAEENDVSLGHPSGLSENLQAGFSCYTHAMGRFSENSSMPIGLNLEIVDFLERINRSEYGEIFLKNAVDLCDSKPDTKVHCMELLGKSFIDKGDYVAALEAYKELMMILKELPKNGARSESLLRCEIKSVFLLLILRPCVKKLSPRSSELLEKFTWGDRVDKGSKACRMSENMFLLMQSLVTICQCQDTSHLLELEGKFWPLLSTDERDLLRILVKTYNY